MRKLIASEFVSLDGFMSDPDDEMDWVFATYNEEMEERVMARQATIDTMLLGRVTYDIFAGYWPTASAAAESAATIEHMNTTPKVVISRTLDHAAWTNSRVIKDDIAEEVRRLKRLPGQNIAIIGSASIVQHLTNHGLIDEYQLMVHPVVLGQGKPLFTDIDPRRTLKLVEAKPFSNGVITLTYQPAA